MARVQTFEHRFVDPIPEHLDEGVLYISIEFTTAAHLCASGCGREVITPLRPRDWHLIFDGETVSLSPSIGNWSFPCQAHYFIKRNSVRWARQWTPQEIAAARSRDHDLGEVAGAERPSVTDSQPVAESRGFIARVARLWRSR